MTGKDEMFPDDGLCRSYEDVSHAVVQLIAACDGSTVGDSDKMVSWVTLTDSDSGIFFKDAYKLSHFVYSGYNDRVRVEKNGRKIVFDGWHTSDDGFHVKTIHTDIGTIINRLLEQYMDGYALSLPSRTSDDNEQ